MEYTRFKLSIEKQIATVTFNRPEKANALDQVAWEELEQIFIHIDENPEIRVAILNAEGKHFTAGIDLSLLMNIRQETMDSCEGRMREKLRKVILRLQEPINAIQKCRKPVLAAIHYGCIGAGVDIISACDMRYCSSDTYFTIKEIDMGMVADVGTLQRLPKIIPDGLARELAFTGRKLTANEAERSGLVNAVYEDKDTMMKSVMAIAEVIASKSPLSIRGTKEVMNYSRDHSIEEGLKYIALWNSSMILSEDLNEAFQASIERKIPTFKN